MKTTLSILLLILALASQAQTVRVPVNMSVDIPLPVQTNVTYITNIFIITNAPTTIVPLQTDAVDAKLGTRLVRFVNQPPTFTFTNFAPGSFATLYWINPAGFTLAFPTNNIWWLGAAPPTNQVRGALLIECMPNNEYWLSP